MNRWFRQRHLRVSLTMWYVGVIIVVLTSYAVIVFAFVSRNSSNALDERLRDDFQWAAAMADQQVDGTLKWFDGDGHSGDSSPWLTVWSEGSVIFRTAFAERNPLPDTPQLATLGDQRIAAVPMEGTTVRVLKGGATIYSRRVTIEVARSEDSMQRQLNELVMLMLLGLPLGVAAAGVGGYLLARRALAPIERMASQARMITAERLSDRLPVDNPNDELGGLASVFNSTLGRLESSFNHMRRFTADVSHELRTPLTAMRSVGEVALRERRDLPAYRAVISSMLEEVDRLGNLVDRLLALSRTALGPSQLPREGIDLRALAEELTTQLGVLAEEKQQTLSIDAAGSATAMGDRIALRQSLMNLIDNAIKYTPSGGRIGIRVWETATAALLEVHDTGPGIEIDARPRIFDRFYRAGTTNDHGAATGFGLGLSIAKWGVEASGGTLLLESTQGVGTTFRMQLPRAAEHALTVRGTSFGTLSWRRNTSGSQQPGADRLDMPMPMPRPVREAP
jgi:heavy metal sensor kinase